MPQPLHAMNEYTLIGYFRSSPEETLVHHVEAEDEAAAIRKADDVAHWECNIPASDVYYNSFVLAGKCEVLSSWAG